MPSSLRVLVAIAVAALVLAGLPAGSPAGAQGGFSPEVEQQLDELAAYYNAPPFEVPGTVVGVSVGDDSYVTAVGTAGYDDPTPVDPEMYFRIGSITKTFTATVVLQLVEECKLSLDDRLELWQPQQPGADQITVENLLDMTSGIPDYQDTTEFLTVLEHDLLHEWQPQQLVDLVRDEPLLSPPGHDWHYSNTNYVILGLIAEEITGQPLEQLVTDRVIEPLGLDHTSFPTTPAIPQPGTTGVAMTFDENINLIELVDDPVLSPSALWAAGAMISTYADLHSWARALADGALLSPEVQAARRQTVDAGDPWTPPTGMPGPDLPIRYGLGLFEVGGLIGHNGDVPGYESLMVHDPDTDTTVVILQNASIGVESTDGSEEPVALPNFLLPWALGVVGQDSPYEPVPPPGPLCPETQPLAPAAPATIAPTTPAARPVPAAARFTG